MSICSLTAPRRQPPSRAAVFLRPDAALDLEGAQQFLATARLVRHRCQRLVVDLRAAEFVDSTGVRALLALRHELELEGKELRLVIAPGSRVERTLRLLQLLERFTVYPTLDAAEAGQEPTLPALA